MLVILMVTEMMMLMVAMTMSMEIMTLDGPMCEHVLQPPDMIIQKPGFLKESGSAGAAGHNGKLPARGSDLSERRLIILHDLYLHHRQWSPRR